ncbi:hypothetical protein BN137_4313 [Cronobacter condimenti 1330]|uniref:Uncharacterized protein n=1 Tax=Cronobacter condimenti 1330 TaxID=1073999 RepID=K8AKV4_9ENTR|nr:hypothetical protein BN137_4313 [Cronobacter condimenti 1330]
MFRFGNGKQQWGMNVATIVPELLNTHTLPALKTDNDFYHENIL